MGEFTEKLNLWKPIVSENVNLASDFNNNWDELESRLGNLNGLTEAEINQLKNLGDVSVSYEQWGALGAYAEGEWTPDLQFGEAKVGITYDIAQGVYTRIGNRVWLSGYIDLLSKGTSNGDAEIFGLPFTSRNYNGAMSVASLSPRSITFADFFQGTVEMNTDKIALSEVTNGGVRTTITDADFVDSSRLRMSVSYEVA